MCLLKYMECFTPLSGSIVFVDRQLDGNYEENYVSLFKEDVELTAAFMQTLHIHMKATKATVWRCNLCLA